MTSGTVVRVGWQVCVCWGEGGGFARCLCAAFTLLTGSHPQSVGMMPGTGPGVDVTPEGVLARPGILDSDICTWRDRRKQAAALLWAVCNVHIAIFGSAPFTDRSYPLQSPEY